MRITATIATLPAGPYVTQHGHRVPSTLLAPAEMGQPQNYGRCAWDDATTPRTDRPVRFNAGYRLHAFAEQLGRTFAPSFTYRQRVD